MRAAAAIVSRLAGEEERERQKKGGFQHAKGAQGDLRLLDADLGLRVGDLDTEDARLLEDGDALAGRDGRRNLGGEAAKFGRRPFGFGCGREFVFFLQRAKRKESAFSNSQRRLDEARTGALTPWSS